MVYFLEIVINDGNAFTVKVTFHWLLSLNINCKLTSAESLIPD